MIQTVRELQEISLTKPTAPQHTKVYTSPTIDICNDILQQIILQTIQLSLKNLVSSAFSIIKHIQQHLCQEATLFIPVPKDAVIAIHSVVDVDRHMPIILVTIGKQQINEVFFVQGFGVNVITKTECCRLRLPKATPAPFKFTDGR